MRVAGVFRLPGGGFLDQSPSHLPSDLMRPPFDRREVEIVDLVVGAKDLAGNLVEDLLEATIRNRIFRGAKHGKSSVTESSYPNRPGFYQKLPASGIDL